MNICARGVCACWAKLVQHSTKPFFLSNSPFKTCWKLEAFVFLDLVNEVVSRCADTRSRRLR